MSKIAYRLERITNQKLKKWKNERVRSQSDLALIRKRKRRGIV